ncbi:uncharacterized protein LOC133716757 [Rosa rugosa]|uniref:uncharacterized protein LOC133716757 n=1 Tax=Rosa rugosa TaxID=74645 RepID=UPI002B40DE54|nr:uncharacterized protein LOC133716757 [Rosa rugosa]
MQLKLPFIYAKIALLQSCPEALGSDLVGWLKICVQSLSQTNLGELLYLLWGAWKERNNRVWDEKSCQPWDVFLKTSTRLRDFDLHNQPSVKLNSRSRLEQWKAPAFGLYKINVGGSFNHVTRKGSCGFVVRDSTGTMIAAGGKPLFGLLSAEHAEAMACGFAFGVALEQNLVPAIVETNSLLVQQ